MSDLKSMGIPRCSGPWSRGAIVWTLPEALSFGLFLNFNGDHMRQKKGDCWFLIEADCNAGMHRVKLARNYKGAIIKYLGGGGGW